MPYASLIIPTFDRASTLTASVASARAQTIAEIEILLVLDGASDACRQIATTQAAQDHRVRVLELPKSRGSGEENVDLAIAHALSDRIFYNDDDDILLPNHVATLGPMLDAAHIADSRVASAGRQGDLHLAPAPSGAAYLRGQLAKFQHKTLFDTHIAHRRQAYQRFASWVPKHGPADKPVWRFFSGFASHPDCIWASAPDVTAISLHGANRRDMTPAQRADEISMWFKLSQDHRNLFKVISSANSAQHYLRLISDCPPQDETYDQHLSRISAYADMSQDDQCRALFDLNMRTEPAPQLVTRLIATLSAPGFVGRQIHKITPVLLKAFDERTALKIMHLSSAHPQADLAGVYGIQALLHMRLQEWSKARCYAAKALDAGPDILGQSRDLVDLIESRARTAATRSLPQC